MTAGPRLLLSTHLVRPSSAFLEWLAWHRVLCATEVAVFIDRREVAAHPLLSALGTAGVLRLIPVGVDPDMKEEAWNAALRAGALEAEASVGAPSVRAGGIGASLLALGGASLFAFHPNRSHTCLCIQSWNEL